MNVEKLPCPACGFMTVPEGSYGTFNICEVCGWEDDALQLANPGCGGGANGASMVETQVAALALYPLGETEAGGFLRDRAWRPLNREEIAIAERERAERPWKNASIFSASATYWNETT